MKRFILALACCLFCTAPAWSDDAPQLSREQQMVKLFPTINFIDFHDPGYFTFETPEGKHSLSDFFYVTIQYDDIKSWKNGEELNIVIDEKKGVGVIRANTGEFYKIFFHPDWHPINIASQICLDNADTTIDINNCHIVEAKEWQTEQKIALEQAGKILGSEGDANILRATQVDWDTYDKKMKQAFRNYTSGKDGTMYSTLGAIQSADIERSRYFEIMDFMGSD